MIPNIEHEAPIVGGLFIIFERTNPDTPVRIKRTTLRCGPKIELVSREREASQERLKMMCKRFPCKNEADKSVQ